MLLLILEVRVGIVDIGGESGLCVHDLRSGGLLLILKVSIVDHIEGERGLLCVH